MASPGCLLGRRLPAGRWLPSSFTWRTTRAVSAMRSTPRQALFHASTIRAANVVEALTAEAEAPTAAAAQTAADVAAAAAARPFYGPSTPPDPPSTEEQRAAQERAIRLERRRKLAQHLAKLSSLGSGSAKSIRAAAGKGRRFWKTVRVGSEKGEEGEKGEKGEKGEEGEKGEKGEGDALLVYLDNLPLRHPTTRAVLRLPARKALLAHALAAEWDSMSTMAQATMRHRIPLTSLVCRAMDLQEEMAADLQKEAADLQKEAADLQKEAAAAAEEKPTTTPRAILIANLMRYLDTDSVLCWAPPDEGEARPVPLPGYVGAGPDTPLLTLHEFQRTLAEPLLSHLATRVWPGLRLEPVLGNPTQPARLMPRPHPPEVRAAVEQWLWQQDGWTLAGLERATLAGKSLVTAVRLVTEWGPAGAAAGPLAETESPAFTVDDAVAATSAETVFQTAQWGEVEDTHDVEKADMRRHYASVVLLVSG